MRLSRMVGLLVALSLFGVFSSRGQVVRPTHLTTGPPGRLMLLGSAASERLFEDGRAQLIAFRLYDAERTFRRLARRPDGVAAARYYLATASFFKALVTEETVYFDEFFGRSDSLRRDLEALSDSRWKTYLLAENALQRALAEAYVERYVRAALSGRAAYRLFSRLLEDDPTFYEAYKGIGLLHLFIGSMPRGQRRLLKILGYGGSVRQGMHALQQAATHSRLHHVEASIYWALADVTLNNSAAGGVQTLQGLYEAYPESALCAYLYGLVVLFNRRAADAEPLLRAAVEAGAAASFFYIDYAEYYLAQALFRQNRFAEATPYYRHYVERHRGAALNAAAYYEIGVALEMQGRRAEATAYYGRVAGRRANDTDQAAYRAARQRLARPMTAQERHLLLGRNAYDAGAYGEAARHLRVVYDATEASAAAYAEAAYRLGRVYHALGRHDDAQQAYHYAVQHPGDASAQWAPWSRFYLGTLYAERGDLQQAREAYEAVLAYERPFDFHLTLEQQTRAALSRIQEGS